MQGGWEPGIGDPTFFGWLAVLLYFAAAYLSYRAGGWSADFSRGAARWHWMERAGARGDGEDSKQCEESRASIFKLNYSTSTSETLLPTFWFACVACWSFWI